MRVFFGGRLLSNLSAEITPSQWANLEPCQRVRIPWHRLLSTYPGLVDVMASVVNNVTFARIRRLGKRQDQLGQRCIENLFQTLLLCLNSLI